MSVDTVSNNWTDATSKDNTFTSEPFDGDGGSVLSVYSDTRSALLNFFGRVSTNESSFEPPNAITTASNNWTDSTEVSQGYGAVGRVLDPDGGVLGASGEVLDSSDEPLAAGGNDASGTVIASQSSAPGGVVGGSDDAGSGGPASVDVSPKPPGITATRDPAGALYYNFGVIQYSEVVGEVTDALGDPVEDVSVFATGGYAESGEGGEYTLRAPSGGVTITSLRQSIDKDTTVPGGGGSTTLNFQFSGVRVRVLLPDGSPVKNIPVYLPYLGETQETNSRGEVTFATLPLNTAVGTVTVGKLIDRSVSTGGEGGLTQVVVNLGGAVRGRVADNAAENPSRDVDVEVQTSEGGFVSPSDTDGSYVGGVISNNWPIDATVVFGANDPRYVKREEDVTLTQGNVEDLDVDLVRALTPTQVK